MGFRDGDNFCKASEALPHMQNLCKSCPHPKKHSLFAFDIGKISENKKTLHILLFLVMFQAKVFGTEKL
jgi:hypothetical protein